MSDHGNGTNLDISVRSTLDININNIHYTAITITFRRDNQDTLGIVVVAVVIVGVIVDDDVVHEKQLICRYFNWR